MFNHFLISIKHYIENVVFRYINAAIIKTNKLNLKNQASLESDIATNDTRIYTYDDGNTVRVAVTKDDNAVESTAFLAENTTNINPFISLTHGGKKENSAGNNGFGQSAKPFYAIGMSDTVSGTRTSNYIFTRASGTWETGKLIGQYAFSYVSSDMKLGTWSLIVANTDTTITVSETLYASCDTVMLSPWKPLNKFYAHGSGGYAFRGGVFDGQSIWLLPFASSYFVKVNPATGAMTYYAHGMGAYAYFGGVFDGNSIWLVPSDSAYLTKVNPATGAMTHYAHGQGSSCVYRGGVFDGQNVWLVPRGSAYLTKVNPATGAMTHYAHGQGDNAYFGGVFDGQNIWLVPNTSPNLTKVNPATGAMTHYAHGQGNYAYQGGVFDGQNIWLVPYASPYLTKVNPATGAMTHYAHGQGTNAYVGGVFDGQSIWLVPVNSPYLTKVNPTTGAMTHYAHGQGTNAYVGCVFDGQSIWLVPQVSPYLTKIIPPEFGIEKLPVSGNVTTHNFETNIAAGTANKDLTVPPYCTIQSVVLINTLSSGNITNFQGVLDPSGDNITLFSGKTIPNGKSLIISSLADHYYYTTTKTLRFNATGNGTGGIEIVVTYSRRV